MVCRLCGSSYSLVTEEVNSFIQVGQVQSSPGCSRPCSREGGITEGSWSQFFILLRNEARLSRERSSARSFWTPTILNWWYASMKNRHLSICAKCESLLDRLFMMDTTAALSQCAITLPLFQPCPQMDDAITSGSISFAAMFRGSVPAQLEPALVMPCPAAPGSRCV